ncbi:MAG: pimeloyl-ACP methyl ester carboxylesterase [Candidatus Azotimanducaceae bacterium]|jgi:pimeloyl-ACP methyl ester carboxylesterase
MFLSFVRTCSIALLLTNSAQALSDYSRTYIDSFDYESIVRNGPSIAYKDIGSSNQQTVILVMGLGASHALWGDDFVRGVVDAGYRVVLIDNRDTGKSDKFTSWGEPTVWWQLLKNTIGFQVDAPYLLDDMAADVIAVMDELNVNQAHIVGASMGGMIAQIIASSRPERVLSLTSIMSTTGAPHLPPPSSESTKMLRGLADGQEENTRAETIAAMGFDAEAVPRQLMAIIKTGDRSKAVASIKSPTLVLHGADDTLIPVAHGEHTAELIKNSTFEVFQGMGHNLPEEVLPRIIESLTSHLNKFSP